MDYIHILKSKCKSLSKLKKYSFDERYIATDTGRIYLIKRIEKNTYMCKALKPYIDRQGYVEYVLTDTQGIKKEIILDPQFEIDVYDYEVKELLPYTVQKLEVEATASRENAQIIIEGNTELKEGKNEIAELLENHSIDMVICRIQEELIMSFKEIHDQKLVKKILEVISLIQYR